MLLPMVWGQSLALTGYATADPSGGPGDGSGGEPQVWAYNIPKHGTIEITEEDIVDLGRRKVGDEFFIGEVRATGKAEFRYCAAILEDNWKLGRILVNRVVTIGVVDPNQRFNQMGLFSADALNIRPGEEIDVILFLLSPWFQRVHIATIYSLVVIAEPTPSGYGPGQTRITRQDLDRPEIMTQITSGKAVLINLQGSLSLMDTIGLPDFSRLVGNDPQTQRLFTDQAFSLELFGLSDLLLGDYDAANPNPQVDGQRFSYNLNVDDGEINLKVKKYKWTTPGGQEIEMEDLGDGMVGVVIQNPLGDDDDDPDDYWDDQAAWWTQMEGYFRDRGNNDWVSKASAAATRAKKEAAKKRSKQYCLCKDTCPEGIEEGTIGRTGGLPFSEGEKEGVFTNFCAECNPPCECIVEEIGDPQYPDPNDATYVVQDLEASCEGPSLCDFEGEIEEGGSCEDFCKSPPEGGPNCATG